MHFLSSFRPARSMQGLPTFHQHPDFWKNIRQKRRNSIFSGGARKKVVFWKRCYFTMWNPIVNLADFPTFFENLVVLYTINDVPPLKLRFPRFCRIFFQKSGCWWKVGCPCVVLAGAYPEKIYINRVTIQGDYFFSFSEDIIPYPTSLENQHLSGWELALM